MKRILNLLSLILVFAFVLFSCAEQEPQVQDISVSNEVAAQISALGFDVENFVPTKINDGYLVEGDIYLTDRDLAEMSQGIRLAAVEQYSTNNLVSTGSGRVITVYIPVDGTTDGGGGSPGRGNGKNKSTADARGGKPGGGGGGGGATFSSTYVAALDEAISRFNAENLTLSFQRVTSSGADIDFTRLGSFDEGRGVLGSAGFPTSNGDPYGNIQMSGILESTYGLSVNGIATIMAHEMGHCIGFRHTDFFDRSISCGGSTANEGDGGVGANHIPGTPTGATLQAQSWMLACTDGSNRNFNNDDKTALDYLY